MYNFNHLYYFYITAKSGSVGAAATHLNISQPSLSSQIRVLEERLDTKLFQKVGRRNQLTEAGSVIFGFCRRMFEISEEMSELILGQLPSAARRIKIGVSDEVERSLVVEVVSLFLKKHGLAQRPHVTMASGNHEQLVNRLRFREIDAVVTQYPLSDPQLHSLMRAQSPVVLACSTDLKSTLKRRQRISASAISQLVGGKGSQWVMPLPHFKLRAEIDRFFEAHQMKGRTVFESDVMDSVVRGVIDGIGFSFLPLIYVPIELRVNSIRLVGPEEGFWKYSVWLGCHTQNPDDPIIKALARSFKLVCDRLV